MARKAFDFSGILENLDINESFTLQNISRTFDVYGSGVETVSGTFTVSGVFQTVSTEDEEVKEGRLEPEDLIVFVDDDDAAVDYFLVGNKVVRGGIVFFVHYADKLEGHYELGCKRE